MVPHMLGSHNAPQVVAHNREAEPRRDIALAGTRGKRGGDCGLNEHRAALAKVKRCRALKRHPAKLRDGNTHAGGLLLHEGAGAGRTYLVHLEVDHLARLERDKLGVLTPYLEDRVGRGVGLGGRRCLGGYLVANQVGTDELAHALAPRAGRRGGDDANARSRTAAELRQTLAYGPLRVATRTQVERVHDTAAGVDEHEVRRGRAHVYAEGHVGATIGAKLEVGRVEQVVASPAFELHLRQGRKRGQRIHGSPSLERGDKAGEHVAAGRTLGSLQSGASGPEVESII